jgi:hypothetical protein
MNAVPNKIIEKMNYFYDCKSKLKYLCSLYRPLYELKEQLKTELLKSVCYTVCFPILNSPLYLTIIAKNIKIFAMTAQGIE